MSLKARAPSDAPTRADDKDVFRFLSEAGRILASSLEYDETLRTVARLAVRSLADWCVVDVVEGTRLTRLAVAHADPAKETLARELAERYPPDIQARTGVAQALRSGQAQLMTTITPELLEASARDAEHLAILQQLGLRSALVVPMIARGRTLGAMTLVSAESGRAYQADDLDFATELASRAAVAIDNARLYRDAERRAREEAALRRAAAALSASFTIEEVIQQIAESALDACGTDAAIVGRIDLARSEVVLMAVAGEKVVRSGMRIPYAHSYTRRVVEKGQPEIFGQLQQARVLPGLADHYDDWSGVVLPLLNSGEAIGSLLLLRRPDRESFHADEIARALTFGSLAALAFRKVHLLQESEKAREELQRVMESRARLMRGFSHDLKNPLGAADGHAALLEDGVVADLGPRARESVRRIRQSLREALELIDELVDLARAEAAPLEIESEPVQVREAVQDMVEEYRAAAQRKGLTLELEVSDDCPIIESDSRRLRQVLGNLLSNAVKYTDRGQIQVSVSLQEGRLTPGSGQWIGIGVRDTGPGIRAEDRALLFQEFVRLGVDSKPGAGLGLAISDRIAQALRGKITVQSQPGRGSTFTLWLPLTAQQRQAA